MDTSKRSVDETEEPQDPRVTCPGCQGKCCPACDWEGWVIPKACVKCHAVISQPQLAEDVPERCAACADPE